MNESVTPANPAPATNRFPTMSRFWRWLTSWRMIRRYLLAFAGLATVVGLFYAVENWRGRRAWEAYKTEWEAKGERFDLASFIPPTVPDDQNFAMTPLLKPLLDYARDPDSGTYHIQRDTNGFNRAQALGVWLNSENSVILSWRRGKAIDLKTWQAHFLELTNASWLKRWAFPVLTPKLPAETNDPAVAVLFVVNQKEAELNELKAALQRPHSRFNIHYEDNFSALLPHLHPLKSAAMMFVLRASAELSQGKADAAWTDVQAALGLADTLKNEPFLVSGLVSLKIREFALQAMWEGLAVHLWSEPQLRAMEAQLASIDELANFELCMRGERASVIDGLNLFQHNPQLFDYMSNPERNRSTEYLSLIPSGWLNQNKLSYCRIQQELPAISAAKHRVYPELANQAFEEIETRSRTWTPYTCIIRIFLPAYGRFPLKFALGQASVEEARIACALERYRLAHGQFPETLAALAPGFVDKMPFDIIDGQPLRYRRTQDGQFVLYSIGWNQKDDGGKVEVYKNNTSQVGLEKGDWVWTYPAHK